MMSNKKFRSWDILQLSQQLSNVTKSKVFFHLAHLAFSVYRLGPKLVPQRHTLLPQFQASHNNTVQKKKKHFSIQLFSSQRQYFPANSPLHYFTKWAGQLMEINLVSLENSWDKENIDKLLSRKIISTYIFTISTYFSTFCQSDST